jgi:N-methylhydantoinase B
VISIMTETFGGTGGARTFADGVDVGGLITNPISRMANVETVENNFPIRYLFRRRRTDSGGAGKYRGGTGLEFAVVPHDGPDGGLHYVISGKGQKHAMTDGLSGGYPGARNRYIRLHCAEGETNGAEMARTLDELPGEREEVSWGVYPLMERDMLYVATNGGGGYLDPLERDPGAVQADVCARVVSREAARSIYGVVIDDRLALDEKATARLRQTLLDQRRQAIAIG